MKKLTSQEVMKRLESQHVTVFEEYKNTSTTMTFYCTFCGAKWICPARSMVAKRDLGEIACRKCSDTEWRGIKTPQRVVCYTFRNSPPKPTKYWSKSYRDMKSKFE